MNLPAPLDPLRFPLHGSRLIEASAGTGKTWTIAALYVRLVLGHGGVGSGFPRPLLPTDILVVTFTEAATQELRDRIRVRLAEAARVFRGQAGGDDFLRRLVGEYPASRHSACARMLEVAAEWMDEAAIHTIHGWCNRMLRQHAFHSGTLFDLEIDEAGGNLQTEAVQDYWRLYCSVLECNSSAAVARVAVSPDQLLKILKPVLRESRVDWWIGGQAAEQPRFPAAALAAWGQWEAERQRLETEARALWRADRPVIEALLRQASAEGWLNGSSYPPKTFENRLTALAGWAERGAACDPKWRNGFGQSALKMNKKKEAHRPEHPALLKLDELAAHDAIEPSFGPELLAHAAAEVRRRYALEKQRRSRLDFDDLPNLLDAALRGESGTDLAAAVRTQYPVALIDEFQDTDPLQYGIFGAIYRIDRNPADLGCFMIGDPKQAIYSFRGADLHTYLRARADTAGRHYTLGRNFRSTAALVAAVNRVFAQAEAFPEGAFRFRTEDADPIPYLPVDARGRAETLMAEGQPVPALSLWLAESEEPIAMSAYREQMAESAATAMVRLLNLGAQGGAGFAEGDRFVPLRPADLAVLVRGRTEADRMRAALASRGVRSVYLSDQESVYASPEAADLLRWLRAVAEPERDANLRAALATATLDLGYARLDALGHDELQWEAETERFRDYRKLWRRQGVLPMLSRLLRDFDLPARLLARAGGGGERTLTNLLHLFELLQAATASLDGEQALLRFLADALAEAGENGAGDEAVLRLESDAGLVKIVTVHKSKGLEYPLVFLPFACSFREVNGKQHYYRYHGAEGRLRLDFDRGEEAKALADRERMQEDIRLLYVALTRARHALWVGVAPVKVGNGKSCQLGRSGFGYLLAGGEEVATESLSAKVQLLRGECSDMAILPPPAPAPEPNAPSGAEPVLEPARGFRGRVPEHWWIASYSALRVEQPGQGRSDREQPSDEPETPVEANLQDESVAPAPSMAPVSRAAAGGLHEFPSGPNPGVFLHGLLEWAAREGFGRVLADAARREDMIARRCQVRGWTRWIEPLDRWLRDLLAAPLPVSAGGVSLGELRTGAIQPELEFWFEAAAVDTRALDRLVTAAILPGRPRPPLAEDRLNGMLKGFIDLAFEHRGRYYLMDYKSNRLGTEGTAYTADAMAEAIMVHRYDLQYCLYLLALHRQLKARLGAGYDYDRQVGGVIYWFMRALDAPTGGIFQDRPPRALIEKLDRLFAGEPGHGP